jgi:hypothetical protein
MMLLNHLPVWYLSLERLQLFPFERGNAAPAGNTGSVGQWHPFFLLHAL